MAKQVASLRRIKQRPPRGIRVKRSESELVINKRWLSGRTFLFLAIGIIMGWAFFYQWKGIQVHIQEESGIANGFLWFVAVCPAVLSVVFLYVGLAKLINRTMIRVSRNGISVTHGPLPFRRSRRVDVDKLVFFHHKERRRRLWWRLLLPYKDIFVIVALLMGIRKHRLLARLQNGRVIVLLSEISSDKEIAYIRGTIASFLGLDQWKA